MRVLVTGGVGYIGSHTVIELLTSGHDVVVFDNLSTSHISTLDRIAAIAGRAPMFIQGDIRDHRALDAVFSTVSVDAVIHFAGLKSVGDSLLRPGEYWDNNVVGSITLTGAMNRAKVRTLVFSSSAAIYGIADTVPVREDAPARPMSPYANTKRVVESLLYDIASSPEAPWRIANLRYFNPVGAHASGLIGEVPSAPPSNLMPSICQVAAGSRQSLNVYGTDYPTKDGTGVRDFIHVVDLAQAHLSAVSALQNFSPECPDAPNGIMTVNLGTGIGYSVLDVVKTFEGVIGRAIPLNILPRRNGDIGESYADPSLAHRLLGWHAQLDLRRMCEDAWRWQQTMNASL